MCHAPSRLLQPTMGASKYATVPMSVTGPFCVCQVLGLYGLASGRCCHNLCSKALLVFLFINFPSSHRVSIGLGFRVKGAGRLVACSLQPSGVHQSGLGIHGGGQGGTIPDVSASSSRLILENGPPRTTCPSTPAPSVVPCSTDMQHAGLPASNRYQPLEAAGLIVPVWH